MSNKLSYSRHETSLSKSLQPLLMHGLKGIEKEGLRMTREGTISLSPHPAALGSALTHPNITTDYSEALLELITPALSDGSEMLGFLTDLHRYVCANIHDELLLAASMPVGDLRDSAIPIARYGSSNVGRMKHIYRRGLIIAMAGVCKSLPGSISTTRFRSHSGRNTSSSWGMPVICNPSPRMPIWE